MKWLETAQLKWIFVLAVLVASTRSKADELAIFEVRRNIPLSDTDPVYKDFYVKGAESVLDKPPSRANSMRTAGNLDRTPGLVHHVDCLQGDDPPDSRRY